MDVIFERVDERRYRVGAHRNGRHDVGPDIAVRPGPGSADVPHDLVHFVVEEVAGLRLGIYGQVAAGGDCGGFFREQGVRRGPEALRRTRRLGGAGRADVAQSERLAALVDPQGRVRASAGLDERLRRRIDDRLAGVLEQWRAVPSGGRLVLTWPDALTVRKGAVPSR